jgi:hypothetical protein
VARLNKGTGVSVWVGKESDCPGAIRGGDPCRNSLSGIDGNSEGCFVSLSVFWSHRRKIESLCSLRNYWGANQPATMICHKCDRSWSDERGRANEICLVLPTGIISDDDKFPRLKVSDDLIDRGKFQFAHGHVMMTAKWFGARSVQDIREGIRLDYTKLDEEIIS